MTKQLRKEISFTSVEMIERVPENFPPISCNRSDFREILYHLTRNALEAMNGIGKLVLRAQLSFSSDEKPCIVITLSDTGPGIAQLHLPNLFKPFFTTKRELGGNGLGLYLTKMLVLRNGGKIAVSSFKDSGTTFTLEFPLAGPI